MPKRQVCPLCGIDDDVTWMPHGDGSRWDFICSGDDGHETPYTWLVKEDAEFEGRSGVMAELGIYDDLLECLRAGEPWVEHGVVEHRYKLLRPDVYFGELLPRYGHVAIAPTRYSTSTFLAQGLSHLLREGAVEWQYSSRTGFWSSYAQQISYWALPPSPPFEQRLTWVDYAKSRAINPDVWDLSDPRT